MLPHPADADAFADDLAIFTRDSVAVLPALDIATSAPATLPAADRLEMGLSDQLDDYERLLIQRALQAADGVVAEAARRLQTDRPNLYRRMRRLGISGVE